MPSPAFDRHMMEIALRLACRGLGQTAPNPAVGAIIADETSGELIARGWTQPGGRPHAETEAIRRAADRARGATMYVTLEPCSHHGKTPPCADAIIGAGLRRVVCAIEDPDPRVAGRGLDRLRKAGLAVERGLLAARAHWITRGHILRVTERRPMVQIKMAVGADGWIQRASQGRPVWVTGPEARAHGHMLRAMSDAILVGRQTVLDDDPELTCRLPGLGARSPQRVVLATKLDRLQQSRLVTVRCGPPVRIFCAEGAAPEALAQLQRQGARVEMQRPIGGGLWLPAVMEALVAEGITRLLVEGGPRVWQAFGAAGLVDEVVLYHARAPHERTIDEARARSAIARYMSASTVPASLRLADHRHLASDDALRMRREWPVS